jgi:mono/diheme cytochrome c family protein
MIHRSLRFSRVAAILAVFASSVLVSVTNASDVERGRYLSIAANCVACHTREGGAAYAGGLPFETPFGVLYSSNITSDPVAGIGRWSERQFIDALRRGVRPDGQHLYPAFPYTAYTLISDQDAKALYAYFKTVKASRFRPPQNAMKFPFGERRLLGPWKQLYFEEARFVADSSKSRAWNRGAYLVEALGHCGACHSPRNRLGAESKDWAMTGGVHGHKDRDGKTRTWSASNLTSAPGGLAAWSHADLVAYLGKGISPRAAVFGPMNEVIASTSRLSQSDIAAMATYLKSIAPLRQKVKSQPADADTLSEGRILYNIHCGTCHQGTGLGGDDTGPPLKGSAVVNAPTPESLINVVLRGPDRPHTAPSVEWQSRKWQMMEPFGDKLADDEVALILTYVRSAWGHEASTVSESEVARQR